MFAQGRNRKYPLSYLIPFTLVRYQPIKPIHNLYTAKKLTIYLDRSFLDSLRTHGIEIYLWFKVLPYITRFDVNSQSSLEFYIQVPT